MRWRTFLRAPQDFDGRTDFPVFDFRPSQHQLPQYMFEHLVQMAVAQTHIIRERLLDRGCEQRLPTQGFVVERLRLVPSRHLLHQTAAAVRFLKVVTRPKDVLAQLQAPFAVRRLATAAR